MQAERVMLVFLADRRTGDEQPADIGIDDTMDKLKEVALQVLPNFVGVEVDDLQLSVGGEVFCSDSPYLSAVRQGSKMGVQWTSTWCTSHTWMSCTVGACECGRFPSGCRGGWMLSSPSGTASGAGWPSGGPSVVLVRELRPAQHPARRREQSGLVSSSFERLARISTVDSVDSLNPVICGTQSASHLTMQPCLSTSRQYR